MTHPYASRTRSSDRRGAVETNAPTPVSWIVAILFAFILIVGFAAPIFSHLLERGQ